MGIIIYLVLQIVKTELYLPRFYIYCQNPVSFHWNYIGIETGFKKGDPGSTHQIWDFHFYQKEMRELKKRASDEALFFTMFHYFIVFHSKIAPHQDRNSSLRHHSR